VVEGAGVGATSVELNIALFIPIVLDDFDCIACLTDSLSTPVEGVVEVVVEGVVEVVVEGVVEVVVEGVVEVVVEGVVEVVVEGVVEVVVEVVVEGVVEVVGVVEVDADCTCCNCCFKFSIFCPVPIKLGSILAPVPIEALSNPSNLYIFVAIIIHNATNKPKVTLFIEKNIINAIKPTLPKILLYI
jgi:hypothetical protein